MGFEAQLMSLVGHGCLVFVLVELQHPLRDGVLCGGLK